MHIYKFLWERNSEVGKAYSRGLDRVFSKFESSCRELEHKSLPREARFLVGFGAGNVPVQCGSLFKEILHVGLRLGEVLFLTMVKIIRFRSRVRGQRRRSVNSSMLAVQVMRAWPNGPR